MTKKEKNIFQKIIDKEAPAYVVYEDKDVLAFLDIFPVEKGQVLVIPKKSYAFVWEMPEEEYLALQKAVLKVVKKIREVFACGVNILQNNEKIAGQEIFHVHFKVIPRRKEGVLKDGHGEEYQGPEEIEEYRQKLEIKE